MKLQSIAIAAAAVVGICATQQVRAEESSVAACCSDFDGECFTTANNRSNNHACNSCEGSPCADECRTDNESEACKSCCVSYPQHDTPWECPVQSITCLADEYGVGNYSDYHSSNPLVCPNSNDAAYFEFSLGQPKTVEECLTACENTGVPGCCQFREFVSTEQNTTAFGHCRFLSSPAATFEELKNANGTEPMISDRRLLMESGKTFARAVRCEKDPAGTDSPSTAEPTTPGTNITATDEPTTDGGAAQMSASVAVVIAAAVAIKAL